MRKTVRMTGLGSCVAAGIGLGALAAPARADDFHWTGDDDTGWHNPLNWSPQEIPGGSDDVSIVAGPDEALVSLSANTDPVATLILDGRARDARLATNGHRLFVDHLDTTGLATVIGEFADVSVFASDGQAGFDADNLDVCEAACLTLFNDATVRVGQRLFLDTLSVLSGSGEVLLANEFGGDETVGQLTGIIRAEFDDELTIRALGGGLISVDNARFSALAGARLTIDGALTGPFGTVSSVIGTDSHLCFTHPVRIASEFGSHITFIGPGELCAPRIEFGDLAGVAVLEEESVIDGITVFDDRSDLLVVEDATLALPQPVAFEDGSTMVIDGLLRCTATTTYAGGLFTGAGMVSQFGDLDVLAPTTIDMPDGAMNLGDPNAPIDIDLFSGGDLTITARAVGMDNTITGTTNVQEAVLEINTASPTGLGDEMVLNSAILRGTPMAVRAGARIETMGFQDAIAADVTYADGSELAVGSSRLFLDGRTTLEGAEVTGTTAAHFTGDLVADGDGVTSLITLHHPDWDGSAEADHRTLVRAGATLQFFDARSIESTFLDGYDGTITIETGGKLVVTMRSDDEWKMDGVLSLQGTAQVVGDTVVNRGRVEGDGTFNFTPLTNNGLVAPGLPTGRIVVGLDPYVQTVAGTLEIELGGTEAGVDYDVLLVAFQDATLAGTLHVRLVGGFVPEIGQEFSVLEAASIQGQFDQVIDQAGVTVAYTDTAVVLTYVGGVDPADIDGDGVVDFADLLAVLAAWGPCPRNRACPEDIDGDGVVGFADLLLVLAQWT